MDLPGAVIFINKEINDVTIEGLTLQLKLTEVISSDEFNNRLTALPSYIEVIHYQNLRVLVIQDSIRDITNPNAADLILFFHQGLIDIEKNTLGPPGLNVPVYKVNIYELLRYNNSPEVTILPEYSCNNCRSYDCGICGIFNSCKNPCNSYCNNCIPVCSSGGIFRMNERNPSTAHCKNPDNIFNNKDFLNRK